MSGFLYRLGRACYRHHWRTLLTWLLILLIAGLGYVGLHGKFDDEFKLPGSQSMVALEKLQATFPQVSGTSATLIVVAPDGKTMDDPDLKAKVQASVKDMSTLSFVNAAVDPYDPLVAHSISDDRKAGIATVRIPRSLSEITDANRADLSKRAADLQAELPGAQVRIGGEAFGAAIPKLGVVDLLGLIVAAAVLFFTLGSVLAAGMPVVTALLGAGLSMLILLMSTKWIEINSASPMLALMLALAVGIDYALFILSRHRDQLAQGLDPEESAARAVATAGSAVVFAGMTVVIALLGLYIVNIPFLAIMGFFAALAVAVAVCIALTMLPAFMGLMGERMIPKPRRRRGGQGATPPVDADGTLHGPSAWWVGVVTKVPALTVALVVLLLGGLALPALHMELSLPNAGQHTRTAPERQTYDLISKTFGPGYNGPLVMTVGLVQSQDPVGLMNAIKGEVEKVPGVALVPLATPNMNADTGIVQIVPTTGPDKPETTQLVKELRTRAKDWEKTYGTQIAITGNTAVQIDVTDNLGAALLPFGIFVVGLSVLLLMMVFRSVFVPIKAALGYLLSVGSAFGVTSLIFNRGLGRQIINLEDPVPIISFFPIIFMGILFGLAMDYEVFLVSRMREEHVHGTPAKRAVKVGFVHSAKVVVAAALIMFSVFAFFVPEGDATIKPIAFGLAFGVAVDAFLVRMTLVPAVMTLMGEKAWWLPRWLDRILPSFDVEGEGLAHQLKLADWPQPNDTHVVYAEDLTVRDGTATLLAPTSLAAQPGETVVVTGPGPARAALLLALAGKLRVDGGEAKINQAVLTTQVGEVRDAVTYIDRETPDPARELRAGRPLVLIDDADLVAREHPTAVNDLLAHLGERAAVLGVADPRTLEALHLAGARTVRVGLDDPADLRGGATVASRPAAAPVESGASVTAAPARPRQTGGLTRLNTMFDAQAGARDEENNR